MNKLDNFLLPRCHADELQLTAMSAFYYGVWNLRYKLIYYYSDLLGQEGEVGPKNMEPEWELFDPEKDPFELNSVYDDPDYAAVVDELKEELSRLQERVWNSTYDCSDSMVSGIT